jgi:hypothetical protein
MAAFAACGRFAPDEVEEVGHAVGDAFASLDESGQGGGFAYVAPLRRPELMRGSVGERLLEALLPAAHATGCWSIGFSACANGVRERDFGNCTLGSAELAGSATLTFSNDTCSLANTGDSVTREAEFTLTGRRNATLRVSSEGGGQIVTRTATGWSYRVLGMHRVMTTAAGRTFFDIETRTLADIGVTGSSRSTRVVSGGELEVRHNLAKYTTVLAPNELAWSATCNCPVSGTLSGTSTSDDGEAKTASIAITGCGRATVTIGDESRDLTFDRCSGT